MFALHFLLLFVVLIVLCSVRINNTGVKKDWQPGAIGVFGWQVHMLSIAFKNKP